MIAVCTQCTHMAEQALNVELMVIYMIFVVLAGSFGTYAMKIWLARNNQIESIRQTGNNAREYLELKDKHMHLVNAHSLLKSRFKQLKELELDLDESDIEPDDEDDVKLSKLAKSFGIPKGISEALDDKDFQEGIGEILKKNSKPVLALVDNWLAKKTGDDPTNIGPKDYGV